jgi:hypothetical protein
MQAPWGQGVLFQVRSIRKGKVHNQVGHKLGKKRNSKQSRYPRWGTESDAAAVVPEAAS